MRSCDAGRPSAVEKLGDFPGADGVRRELEGAVLAHLAGGSQEGTESGTRERAPHAHASDTDFRELTPSLSAIPRSLRISLKRVDLVQLVKDSLVRRM